MRRSGFYLVVLSTLSACGGPPASVPAHVLVRPAGALLTPSNRSLALTATVLDQAGAPLEGVKWISSDPSVISVSPDGVVTATGPAGSAIVTAKAGDVTAQVVVVSAVPVGGTLMVDDEDVLAGPTLLEPQEELDVGTLYTVRLAVPPPAVGTHVLATGEVQVAGRVVEVAGDVVTLELVPLGELFDQLTLDESLDLGNSPLIDDPDDGLEVRRLADGSWHVSGAVASALGPQAKFGVGPLKCESDFNFAQLEVLKLDVKLTPSLVLDTVADGPHKGVVLHGSPKADVTFEPVLKGVLHESVSCELTVAKIQVPVPGAVGIFLGAVVPVGVGLKLEGAAPVAQAGYHFDAQLAADLSLGSDCDPGREGVAAMMPHVTGHQRPIVPDDLLALRLEATLSGYLFARVEAGLRQSEKGRIEVANGQVGLRLGAKLASEETQYQDAAYSSSYALDLVASVASGGNVQRFFNLLNVTPAELKLEIATPLATWPRAAEVSADVEAFETGDTVTFTVELDPASVTFPVVGYDVRAVRVYNAISGSLVLANEVTASAGQVSFEVPWVATQDGEVGDDFVAFVETELLPSPRLELGVAEPPSEPGTATLTFTVTFEEHYVESAPDYRERHDEVETLTGQYSLDVVSRDDEAIVFEVISGVLTFSHATESVSEEDGTTGIEPVEDSDDDVQEVVPSFHASGSTDESDPNVFSGTLSTGDPGWGTTYTWSLVITPP